MLLQDLRKKSVEYVHVISALEHSHKKIVSPFKDAVIIHCTESNVYVVEYEGIDYEKFCNFLRKINIVRLQTTNKILYERLIPSFKNHYVCQQMILKEKESFFPKEFKLLNFQDLAYVQKSYGMSEYIGQLYERNRLFGWYEDNRLLGYVAFHIDKTIGALFVKPEYRNKGIGSELMRAASSRFALSFPDKTIFVQILSENIKSINLHKKIGFDLSSQVYWVYNEEYCY